MDILTPTPENQQYRGSFQELADARRVLKMMNGLASIPALPAEEFAEVHQIRARAIRCIEAATTELIENLDLTLGDPDEENDPFDDGEPAFDVASQALVNEHGDGPGGGSLLDSDYGDEEAGERDH